MDGHYFTFLAGDQNKTQILPPSEPVDTSLDDLILGTWSSMMLEGSAMKTSTRRSRTT